MSKLNFIAELCQNHQGKLYNIQKMVAECATYGATTIKMQYIFAKNLSFRPQFETGLKIGKRTLVIKRPYINEFKRLKKLDIPNSYYEKFIKACEQNHVIPAVTCFAREHVDILKNTAFKVKSIDENTWIDKHEIPKMKEYQDLLQKDWDQILSDRRKEGMGKFIIMATAGGSGYRVLDNIQNNIISKQTENK